MSIVVQRPGILTTVQDGGRFGTQNTGFSSSGAMDLLSLWIGNTLVGNDKNEAGLETTVVGPMLKFTADTIIALTGADMTPTVNGTAVEMYRAFLIHSGDVLAFGGLKAGCRGYIAFAGGLEIPLVLGSRSTYLKGTIGGLQGRALKAGDEIAFRAPVTNLPNLARRSVAFPPIDTSHVVLRVIRGPQADDFTMAGYETFLTSEYTCTTECDRMGYRLDGPKIEHVKDGNTISEGIPMGGIQVPTQGTPIVMLAEKQCIGGYTKIGTVITPDIGQIAQCKPGDKLRFAEISVTDAQNLYVDMINKLKSLARSLNEDSAGEGGRAFIVTVNGVKYEVEVSLNNPVAF